MAEEKASPIPEVSVSREATCEIYGIHPERIEEARKLLPSAGALSPLANTFKALGDPGRVKILLALAEQELCVCDLAALLHMSTSAISHQLRILRHLNLVRYRKDGKMAFYSLEDEHIKELLREGLRHIEEQYTLQSLTLA
jgi:ArsR family transcriptional regulator